MHATTITGYTYKADLHCPDCMRTMAAHALAAPGEAAFMGRPTDGDTTEQFLDRWAAQEGINRGDETTFDSDDFPKVTFETGDASNELCGTCYTRLDGNVMCKPCAEHGIFRCRETVATCDHCKVYKDVFMEMSYKDDDDPGSPVDTVCLDCLATGEHLKNAHGFESLIPAQEG